MEMDVESYLRRRYEGQISDIEFVEKEDLDLGEELFSRELDMKIKEALKTVALGTSKIKEDLKMDWRRSGWCLVGLVYNPKICHSMINLVWAGDTAIVIGSYP